MAGKAEKIEYSSSNNSKNKNKNIKLRKYYRYLAKTNLKLRERKKIFENLFCVLCSMEKYNDNYKE